MGTQNLLKLYTLMLIRRIKRKLSDFEGVSQNGVHLIDNLRLGVTQNGVHLNLQPGCLFINESGLYSLILRSKLESAKAFK